jgi:protein-tyrosine phosphatase
MNKILFLCTGNYYRSRFSEVLFNHLAREAGISRWLADSRGLHVQPDGVVNHGPISIHTIDGLKLRKIPLALPQRHPLQVTDADLASSKITIAIKEAEHRPLMQKLHPTFADKITYWHVHDLDMAHPEQALPELEALVRTLAAECFKRK